MRLGLMGGTFDPIHFGHLILAEQAWEKFELDKVLFVTAADPPHKVGIDITPVQHRHMMACLATEDNDHFECSTIEMERQGPSYTIDTIKHIKGMYGDDTHVYLLIGADEAQTLMSWRDPWGIQELATIVVANRPGYSGWDATEHLPADFAKNLVSLKMPGVDVSATDLRERVRQGRSIRYLVTKSVEEYIWQSSLFRGQ